MSFKRLFLLTVGAALSLCAASSVYDFSLVSMDGTETPLKTYQGKVLLIVNLASRSIYSTQTQALDMLYRTYREQGLVVLGIPSDDFGHGEPGTLEELKALYGGKQPVSFPIFAKASITGKDQIPLYEFLTDAKRNTKTGGELPWNFSKYLIGRDGNPVARFDAGTPPDSPELMAAIEIALEQKPDTQKAASATGRTAKP
jgi:glutathione peroxidase